MRKTFFFFSVATLLCLGSLAYGNSDASPLEAPSENLSQAAPAIARVRIVVASSASSSRSTPKPTLLPVIDQPDIREKDRIFLDRVLRALPALCRENLEQMIVRYEPNAERGQATATTMLLRGPLWNLSEKKKMEMIGVVTHECGHIISLKAFVGKKKDGISPFPDGHLPTYNGLAAKFYSISWKNSDVMRPTTESNHFVSGYAKENPFEDFAETFAYFVLQKQAFIGRAEKNTVLSEKLAFMEMYIADPGFTFPESQSWDGKIPWDTTKLAHELSLLALP
jgi:hypothetical protein